MAGGCELGALQVKQFWPVLFSAFLSFIVNVVHAIH